MTKTIEKKIATVILLDNDVNVPEDKSLVAKFQDVIYVGNEQTLINELLIEKDIKGLLEKHNDVRKGLVNLATLERNGVDVKLQPIKFGDLTIEVLG